MFSRKNNNDFFIVQSPYTLISPPNSAVNIKVGTYRKGADLIIAYALLFSVSPNTVTKRTEENNHPTPNRYMARGRNTSLLPSVSIYDTAKGASFTCVPWCILKFGDFRIKNSAQMPFCKPRISPRSRWQI